jgi:hypothetical protein
MTKSRRTTDEWIKSRQDMTFVERLSDIQETDRDIKVGDRVMFTNVSGFTFGPFEVIGISKDNELWKYGRCVFLNKDSYWYPCKPEELTLI